MPPPAERAREAERGPEQCGQWDWGSGCPPVLGVRGADGFLWLQEQPWVGLSGLGWRLSPRLSQWHRPAVFCLLLGKDEGVCAPAPGWLQPHTSCQGSPSCLCPAPCAGNSSCGLGSCGRGSAWSAVKPPQSFPSACPCPQSCCHPSMPFTAPWDALLGDAVAGLEGPRCCFPSSPSLPPWAHPHPVSLPNTGGRSCPLPWGRTAEMPMPTSALRRRR